MRSLGRLSARSNAVVLRETSVPADNSNRSEIDGERQRETGRLLEDEQHCMHHVTTS